MLQVNFNLQFGGANPTLFILELPKLEYATELAKFTSAGEMKKEYQEKLRLVSGDPSLDVLQLRSGCVDLICTTRQPLVAFASIASHKCLVEVPKASEPSGIVLHLPIGNDVSLKFEDSQELLEFVQERKQQNLLAQKAAALLATQLPTQQRSGLAAAPSSSIASLPAPQIGAPKATEETIRSVVGFILGQVGNLSSRPHTVKYFVDEDDEEDIGNWMADITWSNTSKDAHDWVAVLVYHDGLQIGTANRETHKWLPFDPSWPQNLVSSLVPLLGENGRLQ